MSRLQVNSRQRRRLQRQLQAARDLRLYRRTLAILEIARGKPLVYIAQSLGVSRRILYYWLAKYTQGYDPQALQPQSRGGRPSVWRNDLAALLIRSLAQSPDHLGYQAVEWTVPLLVMHLAALSGRQVSASSVRRQLHRLGYVWKRPRYVLQPDPAREKKRAIRRHLSHLEPRSLVLFEDETDLLLFPPLRACWAQRGQPAQVVLSGANARRVVFGTLNPRTGHRLFLVRPRQRATDFGLLLRQIHTHYRSWHVLLLLDEDSSHTAGASQRLAAELGIELQWLPKRCPELNPMEKLWETGKQHICVNRQYATIDEEVERFIGYLRSLSPQETLRKAGVQSAHFWLKSVL